MALVPRRDKLNSFVWFLAFCILVVFVGLRHKVGMDWNNYLVMISRIKDSPFNDVLKSTEPGFLALLWLGAKSPFWIYFTNFFTTLIFVIGLFAFLSKTRERWLGLVAALPILTIVVAMSANRQAAAIGVLLLLTAYWYKLKMPSRIALILIAISFHFSALFFTVFLGLSARVSNLFKLVLVISIILVIILFADSNQLQYYDRLYISGQTDLTRSSGALMHVSINAAFGLTVFCKKEIRQVLFPTPLMVWLALLSVAMFPIALLFSVAAGRMSLYLFPVSIYAASAIPSLWGSSRQVLARLIFCLIFVLQSWIWLEFSNSSHAHIPYQNFLTVPEDLRVTS